MTAVEGLKPFKSGGLSGQLAYGYTRHSSKPPPHGWIITARLHREISDPTT